MKNIRKTVTLPLGDDEVSLNVDMRIIEVVERIYDVNVDLVATVLLVDPSRVKLTDLAQVVGEWLTPMHFEQLGIKRKDVKELIYTANHAELSKIVGCVQAACLFVRRHITAEELDALARGEDLPEKEKAEAAPKKKRRTRKPSTAQSSEA